MELYTLNARRTVIIPYKVPRSGLFVILVKSDSPMNAYLADVANVAVYKNGQRQGFRPLITVRNTVEQTLPVRASPNETLYLLLENPSESSIAAGCVATGYDNYSAWSMEGHGLTY